MVITKKKKNKNNSLQSIFLKIQKYQWHHQSKTCTFHAKHLSSPNSSTGECASTRNGSS
jgi:hypothetical protein